MLTNSYDLGLLKSCKRIFMIKKSLILLKKVIYWKENGCKKKQEFNACRFMLWSDKMRVG